MAYCVLWMIFLNLLKLQRKRQLLGSKARKLMPAFIPSQKLKLMPFVRKQKVPMGAFRDIFKFRP